MKKWNNERSQLISPTEKISMCQTIEKLNNILPRIHTIHKWGFPTKSTYLQYVSKLSFD